MRARVTALLMFVCLRTVLAIAQGRGVMVIKVVDAAGAIIPGAAITISGPAQRTCVTNERGECAFAGLPSGQYEVKAELTGFATAVHSSISPRRGPRRVNVVMRVGSLAETVTATGSAPVVETRSAARAMPAPPPVSSPGMPARVGGNIAGYAGGTVATEPYTGRIEAGTPSRTTRSTRIPSVPFPKVRSPRFRSTSTPRRTRTFGDSSAKARCRLSTRCASKS
jgi:hypothetical protein